MKNTSSKGIFRKKIIFLLVLIAICIAAYLKFFMDSHLKRVVRNFLTNANCAEVNIGDLNVDIKNAKLVVKDIQLTNYHEPELNLVFFDKVSFDFLWDGLLRKKFVIENSKINEVTFHTLRNNKGSTDAACKKRQEEQIGIKEKLKSEKQKIFEDNMIEGLISVLKGDGKITERIKNIKLDLKTEKRIKELEATLKEKNEYWGKTYKSFKKFEEVKKLYEDAKKIKVTDDPIQIASALKEAVEIHNKAKLQVKTYKNQIEELRTDVNSFKNKTSELDELVKEDTKYLKKYFNIPDVDLSNFSQDVFKKYVDSVVAPYMRYWHSLKNKIPQVNKTDNDIKPPERSAGVTYHFPLENSYPSFWLKNLDLTSKSQLVKGKEDTSYSFKGYVKNASSDERIVGKPLTFNLNGDLPVQQIKGIKVTGDVKRNYEKNDYVSNIKGEVSAYPIKMIKLLNSSKYKLSFSDALASTSFDGIIKGNESSLKLKTLFKNVNWSILTEKKDVTKILQSVLDKIPDVSLKSVFSGNILKPLIDISSDFDMRFKDGIQKFVGDKLKEGELKLKGIVNDKISQQKSQFISSLNSSQQDILKPLLDSENNLQSMSNAIKSIKEDFEAKQKAKAKKKVEKEINKGLNKLKDKFNLPF